MEPELQVEDKEAEGHKVPVYPWLDPKGYRFLDRPTSCYRQQQLELQQKQKSEARLKYKNCRLCQQNECDCEQSLIKDDDEDDNEEVGDRVISEVETTSPAISQWLEPAKLMVLPCQCQYCLDEEQKEREKEQENEEEESADTNSSICSCCPWFLGKRHCQRQHENKDQVEDRNIDDDDKATEKLNK